MSIVDSDSLSDVDGYLVTIDGGRDTRLAPEGRVIIPGIRAGTHRVVLGDADANCVVDTPQRDVTVVADDTVDVEVPVDCAAVGDLVFSITTTGVDADSDGFFVRLASSGGFSDSTLVRATDTVTFARIPAGDLFVTVSGVASNCVIAPPASSNVDVVVGGVVRATFDVSCIAAPAYDIDYDLVFGVGRNLYYRTSTGQTLLPLTADTAEDYGPAVSPDGSRIAFTSNRGIPLYCTQPDFCATRTAIFVMNPDGTGLTRLTFADEIAEGASWSPDGSRIAYVSSHLGAGGQYAFSLFVMNADGSNRTEIFAATGTMSSIGLNATSWSPDGQRIAFSGNIGTAAGQQSHIFLVNVDGTGLFDLTNDAGGGAEPAWSPDGSEIAFVRPDAFGVDLYTVSVQGGPAQRLTYQMVARGPAWSPDGRLIAFLGSRDPNPRGVYVVAPGGAPQFLESAGNGPGEVYHPAWVAR